MDAWLPLISDLRVDASVGPGTSSCLVSTISPADDLGSGGITGGAGGEASAGSEDWAGIFGRECADVVSACADAP